MKIRCSSLGKIMANAKGADITDKQLTTLKELQAKPKLTENQTKTLAGLITKRDAPPQLSAGGKTYIKSLVNQEIFEYKSSVSTPEMQKGNEVEDESIELFNEVFGSDFMKHNERIENEYIQGECDVLGDNLVVDIKSSWSIETFPAVGEDGIDSDYEWQLRGYMWMYGVSNATLAYCMVDTPEALRRPWESLYLHEVNHIDPRLRISIIEFIRDESLEAKIIEKVTAARLFYDEYKEKLISKNQ